MATPFNKVEDLKKARAEIRSKIWKQMETAEVFNEYLQLPDFSSIRKELAEGVKLVSGNSEDYLVKVSSEGAGIKIDINHNKINESGHSSNYVESVIRSASDTFSKSYYKAKGILPNDYSLEEVISAVKKTLQETN